MYFVDSDFIAYLLILWLFEQLATKYYYYFLLLFIVR